ncbi:alpha-1,3-mannosyl-glycoprotein 4-beta-N-acetylglucosaminyltransferase C-like [Mizuhopecten yessoensis]|uniref:Alpha-1,3-mannosyl-glycoprotein 4-beta-N-acetylglucosaminyltransferase C n=1 Tax=Mizuhopecten yessoensis TaxID=6573 RepID=A0A210QHW1_MIZYE|nr:alpha-1,3-mannosyl-glycoprotein 4-beta-N-acetylglucosaminyltransferase C-like [Mizuhopecten yessoensis]OWF48353.1 Alpha-1,3-mannosyl-glycoprotein 4-beta-N-acetylglucosaminyltransferase C [Mizuhopecten yessoensis]
MGAALEEQFEPKKHAVSGIESLTADWRQEATIFPTANLTNRLLTIGIPTIQRQKSTYFFNTLESLFNCTTNAELPDIYIVIFLADFNEEWKENITNTLTRKYSYYIRSGLLQVVHAPRNFYPSLSNLQHTYNDPEEKRKWRSKQNADYAFLFMYAKPLSTYYMQLEDDVYTVPGYMQSIREHIQKESQGWVCLEFSELGFIGKLFHSKDLEKLAKITLLFYEEQPVDFTYLYFNILMLQFERRIIHPTLFQHIGVQSSLNGKIQPLKDKYFDVMKKQFNGDNPPAKVFTTIETMPDFPPQLAYELSDGYFWTHMAPKDKDTITIVFNTPQHIDKVIIDTGSKEHPTDRLENGKLDASLSLVEKTDTLAVCTNDIFLGTFQNGMIKVTDLGKKLGPFTVHCLRVTATADQAFWLIVREISVFTSKELEVKQPINA